MIPYIIQFLVGLVLEAPVLYYFFKQEGVKEVLLATLALNTVTHPLLIFVLPMIQANYILMLLASEISVIAVEAYLMSFLFEENSGKTFVKASILANIVSWQFAPLLLYVFSLLW